jgi:hypothetical protein
MRARTFIFSLLIILAIIPFPITVFAETQVIETAVLYTFDEQITFRAKLKTDLPIESALVFFQADKDTRTHVGIATITPLENSTYELVYDHNLNDFDLRAFSNVEYRFEVKLKNGDTYKSFTSKFYYEDNRFEWQNLVDAPFQVHWYEGDVAFAQSVLDVAQEGLIKIQSLYPFPAPESLDIYVYSESKAMQDTLDPTSANWVVGHADPDLGVILATLPPGPEQQLILKQIVPHELMHVLLYQATNLGYSNLPTWLSEGLAALAELYPNTDYHIALESAIQKDSLLPMASLCKTFPRDASNALLSYAQAASFTSYLHDTYGITGLEKLVTAYANGLDCEQGAKSALGVNLSQLDRQWRRDALAENIALTTLYNLLPWLVLLAAALGAPLILILRWLHKTPAKQPAG